MGFWIFSVWFCISKSLPRFSSTMVDLGSFLPGFSFCFSLFFFVGGFQGVLSHGAGFLFMLRSIAVGVGTLEHYIVHG